MIYFRRSKSEEETAKIRNRWYENKMTGKIRSSRKNWLKSRKKIWHEKPFRTELRFLWLLPKSYGIFINYVSIRPFGTKKKPNDRTVGYLLSVKRLLWKNEKKTARNCIKLFGWQQICANSIITLSTRHKLKLSFLYIFDLQTKNI